MSAEDLGTSDPRIVFAAERTLLAWIRTGIALMGFGFVVARFGLFLQELAVANAYSPPARINASMVGVVLVSAGLLVNAWASVRYGRIIQVLQRGEPILPSARGPVTVGMATVIGGVVLVVILMTALVK